MQLFSRRQIPPVQTDESSDESGATKPWVRIAAGVCGGGLLGVLIVARVLQPDPSGLGTHEQLNLPPCGVLLVMGIPCPSCGMTTAFAHATRGDLVASLASNAGGCLLAIGSMVGGVWLLLMACLGRWIVKPHLPTLLFFVMLVVLVTMIHWIIKLTV